MSRDILRWYICAATSAPFLLVSHGLFNAGNEAAALFTLSALAGFLLATLCIPIKLPRQTRLDEFEGDAR